MEKTRADSARDWGLSGWAPQRARETAEKWLPCPIAHLLIVRYQPQSLRITMLSPPVIAGGSALSAKPIWLS